MRKLLAAFLVATTLNCANTAIAACSLDIDLDGAVLPETDGLLIVRRLLGFQGTPLTLGAVNPSGNRTDALAIANFIDPMVADRTLTLDGSTNAPTSAKDGLMLVRAMSNLTGAAVTQGAISGTPPRSTWSQIRQYLNSTCGTNFADPSLPVKTTLLNSSLSSPWGMAFLPDGRMLVTQRGGTMVIVSANGASVSTPFSTTLPNLTSAGQGGLLDVALDPDFDLTTNPRIYWTFSETGIGGSGTAVARGNLVGNAIQSAEVIYRQEPKVGGSGHFGSRIVFRSDKTMMVALGERQTDDPANPTSNNAQNLTKTLGKVIRINRDGSIPAGNPTFSTVGALPEIWSLGHRNPQGAAMKPGTDDLWLTEHGPLGGDELNRVLPGLNFGWPLRSYGCPYSAGSNTPACRVGGGTHAPTYEEPKTTWLPSSTAPAGLMFYTGTQFSDLGWQNNVFTGGLAGATLWRIVLNGDTFVSKEEVAVVKALGQRIRVVKQGPDGWIYLLTDSGQLIRVDR